MTVLFHGIIRPVGPVFFIVMWLLLISSGAQANTGSFRVASYNVENLFDLEFFGTEYPDYVPYSLSGWNDRVASVKFANIAKVIVETGADIVALQEVESEAALIMLRQALADAGIHYPYSVIADSEGQAVRCALLSKFYIRDSEDIHIDGGRSRSILKVTVIIRERQLLVFVNHWNSKRKPESTRVRAAYVLSRETGKLDAGTDYIVVGDFNSAHNEYKTIKQKPGLNDTGGVTGINHILKTLTVNGNPVDENTVLHSRRYLYNLWYEVGHDRRWSHIYKNERQSLDSILIPASLYDNKGIDYKDNSFRSITPDWLFCGEYIYRWQRTDSKKRKHSGKGFSDHLPVIADFIVCGER